MRKYIIIYLSWRGKRNEGTTPTKTSYINKMIAGKVTQKIW